MSKDSVSPYPSDLSGRLISDQAGARRRAGHVIGGRQENSWSPSIWARHLGRAPYWTIGIAEQHITVMAPTGVLNIHVVEREKLRFENGSVWMRMSAPELGVIQPLTGLAKRALAEFNDAVAREFAEYESTLDLQPFV